MVDDGTDIEKSDSTDITSQEEETENIDETVSDSDSSEILEQILVELQLNNEKLDEMQVYKEKQDITLFMKPLSEYTVAEGLLLLLFLGFVAYSIFHLVGGILRCKKL